MCWKCVCAHAQNLRIIANSHRNIKWNVKENGKSRLQSNFVVRFHLHLLRVFYPTRFQHMVCACLWQVNWQFWNLAAIFLSLFVRHLPLNNIYVYWTFFAININEPIFVFLLFCCIAIAFDYHNSMVNFFFDFTGITIDWCRHLTCSLTDHFNNPVRNQIRHTNPSVTMVGRPGRQKFNLLYKKNVEQWKHNKTAFDIVYFFVWFQFIIYVILVHDCEPLFKLKTKFMIKN